MGIATLVRKLDRWAEVRRKFGLRAALAGLVDRLANRLVDLKVAHVVWLEVERLDDSLQPDPGLTFRFLSAAEVRGFSADPQNWLDPALGDGIEAGTNLCFAALSGDRLAAFGWYALGRIEAEHSGGTPLAYPPNAAYMYHGFTHPDFRGRRLHGLIMGLGLRALETYGVTRLVSTVEWTNWASLRSCFRLGYISLGRTVVLRCGRFHLARYPRTAKRLGVRFGKNALAHTDAARPCPEHAVA